MTRRPLTWLAATAVVLGVSAAVPTPSAALDLWVLTIDSPTEGTVSTTHTIEVQGVARHPVITTPGTVTVTAVPAFEAPAYAPGCGEPVSGTETVTEGRYLVVLEVPCNGPYRLEAVGDNGSRSDVETRTIAVEEAPGIPSMPKLAARPDGGVVADWPASPDPGAAGWVVVADSRGEVELPPETLSYDLPADWSHVPVALRSVRWGAEGPGGATVVSNPSGFAMRGERDTETPTTTPSSTAPPTTDPPGTTPPPTAGGGTTPPASRGPGTPTRGVGADAPVPEGYTEELPYGQPDDAFVPGEAPPPAAVRTNDGAETASGTPAPAGLVRTSERRSPGLVAPFAIAVMMLAVAAHIAWYLRRSRPQGPGQVSLG